MANTLDHTITLSALNESPLWIFIKNEREIVWVNKRLANAMQLSDNDLTGIYSSAASETPLAPLLDVVSTLFFVTPDGKECWLKREIYSTEDSTTEIHYLSEINELIEQANRNLELEEKLAALDIRDPITGLLNKKAILQSLETQITRSRRYNNPLSLLRLTIEFPDKLDNLEITTATRNIAHCLKDKLRWADQIGVLEERTFLIILPETSYSDAKELAGKLANDRATFPTSSDSCRFRFGVCNWLKGDDSKKMLAKLEEDLELSVSALLS